MTGAQRGSRVAVVGLALAALAVVAFASLTLLGRMARDGLHGAALADGLLVVAAGSVLAIAGGWSLKPKSAGARQASQAAEPRGQAS